MGLPVAVLGAICSGHGCWPSRANIGASPDVFVNGLGVIRLGDPWDSHTCPDIPETHAGVQSSGSGTVFVNGLAVARISDAISCGSTVATGSSDVFVGG